MIGTPLQQVIYSRNLKELVDLAIRDGATLIYIFNELTGDLLNVYGTGNDCQNDAAVTPGAAGIVPPDRAAYDYLRATGSSPLFGHTEGTRPDAGVSTNFSAEIVCRRTGSTISAWFILELRRGGGFTLAGMSHTGGGNFQSQVFTTGNNAATIATGTECDEYAHYVWTYDGANHIGYRNGGQKYNNSHTGNMTDGSPFGLAIGGAYQIGSINGDVDVDFVAIYQGTTLTAEQADEHYRTSGV